MSHLFAYAGSAPKFVVELNNGALHHIKGYQADGADTTITIDRSTLNNIILKKTTLPEALKDKKITIDGNQDSLNQLLSLVDSFNLWFNIVTPNQ